MSTQRDPRDESQTPEELLAETEAALGGPPPPGEAPGRGSVERTGGEPTREQPVPGRTGGTGNRQPAAEETKQRTRGGMSAGMWLSLILGAVVLVLLLVFIVQNNVPADFRYFGWQFELPLGVAMLFAAIGGIFIAGIVGSVRIFVLSRRLKKVSKALGHDHRHNHR